MDTPAPALPLLSALRCWIQGRRVYLEITARRTVSFPTSKYAVLANATQADLEKISLHSDGRYIRWETLDEEICVEDVANNRFVHTPRPATV
jgi:hypothetical protein